MMKYIVTAVVVAAVAFGIYCIAQKKEAPSQSEVTPSETPQETAQTQGTTMAETNNNTEFVTLDSGLQYRVLKEGSGAQAQAGDLATVHYTGWLYAEAAPEYKGNKFDSSVDRGQPFQFGIDSGMVIRGWDEGVALMKEGDKRTFILPAELAYGSNAVGGIIPANATLVFDVELLKLN